VTGWTVYRERIPEIVVPGKPLGRHIHHDSRSLAYAWQHSGAAPATTLWQRMTDMLNQGQTSSCKGNAMDAACGTQPLYQALPITHPLLTEAEALLLYSAAEMIDGDGPYPPNDNGSSGLSVCKAAKQQGLISGYRACLSLADMNDALQAGPVIVGVNWYSGFDHPDASGFVSLGANDQLRGGHEFLVRGTDVSAVRFTADNSWGTGWGLKGTFQFSWDDMARLLSEQGDCYAPVPLNQPAPVPVPVPQPAPPAPAPGPVAPDFDRYDIALANATAPWAQRFHVGGNERTATALRSWLTAKGFIS
jgi:hypothetical protein